MVSNVILMRKMIVLKNGKKSLTAFGIQVVAMKELKTPVGQNSCNISGSKICKKYIFM